MYLKKTIGFIFKNCSKRIEKRKTKLDITASKIYPNDPKLISKIINNKLTKNNRYLVSDAVLNNYSKDDNENYGIVPMLKFQNKNEALWGNKKEINEYLFNLFKNIIEDLMSDATYEEKLNEFFLDFIPYAKNTAFYQVLFQNHDRYISFLQAYGIYEDDIIENNPKLNNNYDEVVEYLYKKCYFQFHNMFLSFVNDNDSFHKIDKILYNFVIGKFIPMLENETDSRKSLGMRVYNLILNDISKTELLLTSYYTYNDKTPKDSIQSLINISSKYITELEKIQEEQIDDFYDITKKQSHKLNDC